MAEKQNNAVATAGNIAHKLHGAAQLVRGAVTADFLAVASGATKLLSPKVIAGIIAAIMLIVMIPILVIFSLPQVLFNWGSLKDTELMARHEHANYLMSCYDDTDLSEEDKLWLISIDAVNNKQDIMQMSQSSISSEKMQGKTPDEVMNEYGFDDDQKNWVTLMVNTIRQAKASNNPDLPIIAGGTNNGIPSEAYNDATFAKLINEAEKYLGYPPGAGVVLQDVPPAQLHLIFHRLAPSGGHRLAAVDAKAHNAPPLQTGSFPGKVYDFWGE